MTQTAGRRQSLPRRTLPAPTAAAPALPPDLGRPQQKQAHPRASFPARPPGLQQGSASIVTVVDPSFLTQRRTPGAIHRLWTGVRRGQDRDVVFDEVSGNVQWADGRVTAFHRSSDSRNGNTSEQFNRRLAQARRAGERRRRSL
ncbi:MAG: hypothetical protein J2P48_04625 [Alphaproteobacteria bacterium]|nr:hypothetical protein [Alphaproteobacteria bacterium]